MLAPAEWQWRWEKGSGHGHMLKEDPRTPDGLDMGCGGKRRPKTSSRCLACAVGKMECLPQRCRQLERRKVGGEGEDQNFSFGHIRFEMSF